MQIPPALHRPRHPRRKVRVRSDLPEQLRPLGTAPKRVSAPRQLALAILLSLAGLLTASFLLDLCAQGAEFCKTPRQTATLAPEAPPERPVPTMAASPPQLRPVLAHAFDALPLSLDSETTRNFVLPPGRTMLDMATQKGRINPDDISLIAVVRQDGVRHALVRLPDGRILRLQQGDVLNGGTVAAISEDALYLIGPDIAPRALVLGG